MWLLRQVVPEVEVHGNNSRIYFRDAPLYAERNESVVGELCNHVLFLRFVRLPAFVLVPLSLFAAMLLFVVSLLRFVGGSVPSFLCFLILLLCGHCYC